MATATPNVRARSDRWDPDRLAQLEHERDVLLRDLRELDGQHADAEIDAVQYHRLRDELTSRTAEVIGLIDRGRAARPVRRRRARTVVATAAGLVLAAVLAGWLLTDQLAPRVPPAPPQAAEAESATRVARLAAVVQDRPDDVPARLALARLLLQQQDLPAAGEQFDAIVEIDPGHAEALAYGGWVTVLTGDVPGGLARLDRAVEADHDYPDAHALRGLALMRAGQDAAAVEELRVYLELAPAGPLASQVQAVIDRLGAAS